jgi:DNA-binding response OmpR family regulator
MRILLVDDETELVTALAERLALRGIDADWAPSGEAALAKVETAAYDVAVLDLKMPGMSGLALMNKLAVLRPAMRYVILTGHGSEEDDRACREAGACSYLMKPLDIEALIAKLKEALG